MVTAINNTALTSSFVRMLAVVDRSVVKFTGLAFRNAYEYFNEVIDEDMIRRFETYMTRQKAESRFFKVSGPTVGPRPISAYRASVDRLAPDVTYLLIKLFLSIIRCNNNCRGWGAKWRRRELETVTVTALNLVLLSFRVKTTIPI